MKCKIPLLFIMTACVLPPVAWGGEASSINFAKGKWDKSAWTSVRLPHQSQALQFIQHDKSIGTAKFTPAQKRDKLDNVLLVTDTGTTEGQFDVTFTIGSEHGTAPGFLIAPVIKDGVLQQAICIFVASYTMAVWHGEINNKTGKFEYRHLARLNRWSNVGDTHIFRCRYSKQKKMFVVQVDDSDPLMFKDTGVKINSTVGIWGCHGSCNYYNFKVTKSGTLPWYAVKP